MGISICCNDNFNISYAHQKQSSTKPAYVYILAYNMEKVNSSLISVSVIKYNHARVAELADALASGASSSNRVQVQPLSRAPSPNYDYFCNYS